MSETKEENNAMAERRILNEKSIVYYSAGGESHLFDEYVSLWDFRHSCERKDCPNEEEHCIFDGQFFHLGIKPHA